MKRWLLLFACAYALLYMFPQPLSDLPLIEYYGKAFDALGLWVGRSLMGISDLKKIEVTGSGDTTLEYVKLPIMLALAFLLSGGLWLFFSKNEKWYGPFLVFVRTYIRWFLGIFMVIYGLAKLVEGGQFVQPTLHDYAKGYGDFSPMGLLWRFMGYSPVYSAFAGMMEVLAGLLLFFRRTTLLGALLTIGVMSNVFMMNMCFDVPVKIFSFHLLLLAAVLVIPDARRAVQFFILNKPVEAAADQPFLQKKWMVIVKDTIKGLILAGFLVAYIFFGWIERPNDDNKKSAVDGIYHVEKFAQNQRDLPLLSTDTLRWSKAIITGDRMELITGYNASKTYKCALDSSQSMLTITSYRDSSFRFPLAMRRDSNVLIMHGLWKKDTIEATLRRIDDNKLTLPSRGFHWVNEYPFNR